MSLSMGSNKTKKMKITDYIYILIKWKGFIFLPLFLCGIIGTAVAYLIPETFKSTAVVMIPPESNLGLSGITSLLGGGKSSAASMGAKLLGGSSTSEDLLLGILNSRMALTNVIKKFDLINYYEIKNNNMDKTIKAFQDDIVFEPNEFDFIDITVVNEDPKKAAAMANYFVGILDSLNILINSEAARNNRIFIEKRYKTNLEDLRAAEDNMYDFQKKYGIFVVPEQLEVSVKAAAEIEAQLTQKEIEGYLVKKQFGETSPQYLGVVEQINLLKEKVSELKNNSVIDENSNVLFPFKGAPNMVITYYRLFREIEIQTKILELVMPMYEQAKVEEQKSIPTVIVIDKAVPAQIKYEPKRAFIILFSVFLSIFILLPFTFRAEYVLTVAELTNPLLTKEKNFYSKVKKFFRVKD